MKTFSNTREVAAPIETVFAAFSDSRRLAKWWGPQGFTNTFTVCEFRNGGRWSFTMHGPDGAKYPNESLFEAIEPPNKVVIQHVNNPKFRLTILLSKSPKGTLVSWTQVFESAEFGESMKHILIPANEQNLDRLTAEVLHPAA